MSQAAETGFKRFLPSEELARMALTAQENAGAAVETPVPGARRGLLAWLLRPALVIHGNLLLPLAFVAAGGMAAVTLEFAPGEMERLRVTARVTLFVALGLAALSLVWRLWNVPETMHDRIEVAPSGPPDERVNDAVERTRESLGARVGRLISELAFSAAARGESELPLAGPGELTELVRQRLGEQLTFVPPVEFLAVLRRDLADHARSGQFGGPWGRVVADAGGMAVRLNPFKRAPADRPRARLLDG